VKQTSYNAGPTRNMPVLLDHSAASDTKVERELRSMRWGLIPSWTKADAEILSFKSSLNTINARDDAILGGGQSMWNAFKNRKRCVVIADGFFEWQAIGKQRLPHYIRLPNDRLLMLAGFYDSWKDAAGMPPSVLSTFFLICLCLLGQVVYSCTIITTASNSQMAFLHERMPVFLTSDEDIDLWLDGNIEFSKVSHLLKTYTGTLLIDQVSSFVNKIGHDTPECIIPLSVSGMTDAKTKPISSFFTTSPTKAVKRPIQATVDDDDDATEEVDGWPLQPSDNAAVTQPPDNATSEKRAKLCTISF